MVRILKRMITNSKGMECHSCEQRIEAALLKIDGIKSVKSDYQTEKTEVEYYSGVIDEQAINKAIEALGYSTKQAKTLSERFSTFTIALGIFAILGGAYLLMGDKISLDFNSISMEAGFAALFGIGFLTGFHCIGMCGGFVLSYSKNMKNAGDVMPHLLYGSGKTISYTIIGALFGALGSIIAFTTEMRASVAIIAGIFLIIYGLNMLNIFPVLRKLQLRIPSLILNGERKKNHGPLVTGLLNGLMIACGPLQALYIFAAGTGSAITGAAAMFFFGLGTLIPLLTFGIATNFMSSALSNNIVRFSGALVIIMGIAMASNGLNLLGFVNPLAANGTPGDLANTTISMQEQYQVIKMNVTRYGWEPNSFVLKQGVPVKWEITGQEINGCNNQIVVREYGLSIKVKQGTQVVEFTPEKEGTIRWSCWMGMIPGQFIVTDDVNAVSPEAVKLPAGSGGCGCGGR